MIITILQFFLSLSILVVLHELGHFVTAKWFKTKVEKFYLFFNPGFALFKKQIGETEYGIGWLPLGGYVKIAGMIDESFDTEQMSKEPQPWEFRSKPAWQRLIIMVGGVFVNAVLGVFLFTMILLTWGTEYILNDELPEGIAVSETAYKLGLRDGDKILKVGDFTLERFSSGTVTKELVINGANTITIERAGTQQTLTVQPELVQELTKHENRNVQVVAVRRPYIFSSLTEDGGAKKAGLLEGDKIMAVNGAPTPYAHQYIKEMAQFHVPKESFVRKLIGGLFGKKKPEKVIPATVDIKVSRDNRELDFTVPMNNGKIGVYPQALDKVLPVHIQEYNLSQAMVGAWDKSVNFIGDQVKAFGQMFSGKIKAKDSLGSFITIGGMFGTNWDWQRFWSMTATLSLLLGFLNLLPIPALDGGYVMFLIFESITGIKVPDRVMEIATFFGFLLLMILMIYAFGLDISRTI